MSVLQSPRAALLLCLPSLPLVALAAQTNIRYELAFDSASARQRTVHVAMRFQVAGPGPVLVSLPAWTPGAYEISNYARKVSNFSASGSGPLAWDKSDFDTWRVRPAAAGEVVLRFDFLADSLDNAMAWSKPDFLLVNGTNVFPYPEGVGLQFPSQVSVTTSPGWRVLTGLEPRGGAPGSYQAPNYHDLVDMPFFIGRFDLDSTQIDGTWQRLASYPAGQFKGPAREMLWRQLRGFTRAEAAVFGETPWKNYSTMLIFDPSYGGGSALEHQSSHVGIYNPGFIGIPLLASITAHEMFHSWNVKRLRPAEMVPYRYDQPEPTTLLWVSEGITDYYADLALLRGGIVDSLVFLNLTDGKRQHTEDLPPVALEDASLSTWIHPTDGTADIYYDKGSLAGLLLDILIRDASDNRRSLDDVLRGLYQTFYKAGKGFTTADWWAAVTAAAGGKSFTEFAARYVDGREPFPWQTVGPLAGLQYLADSSRMIRLGVSTVSDSNRVFVTSVVAGSAAEAGGIEAGDQLLKVGDVEVKDDGFGAAVRARYANADGTVVPVVIKRSEAERTLQLTIRRELVVTTRLLYDQRAGAKAARVRNGILKGTVDR